MFIDPILIDESNPNVIYNGYALPGSKKAILVGNSKVTKKVWCWPINGQRNKTWQSLEQQNCINL